MRNIDNSPKNGAGTVTTKTKYKDYTDFLDNYGQKKDDQESVSSVDSGFSGTIYKLNGNKSNNASNSSLNSEASSVSSLKSSNSINKASYGSYKEFLENYNTKKYSSVKPSLNCTGPKSTVKSKLYIQINDSPKENESAAAKKHNSPSPKTYAFQVNLAKSEAPKPSYAPTVPFAPKPTNLDPNGIHKPPTINGTASVIPKPNPEEKCKQKTDPQTCSIPPVPPKMPENLISNGISTTRTNGNIPVPPKFPPSNTLPRPSVTSLNKPAKQPQINGRPSEGPKFVPPTPEFLEDRIKKLNTVENKYVDPDFDTTTVIQVDENGKIDKNDPNVKKLVYNTYRGLLGAYNNKANHIISTLPRNMVREDRGITKQLESIA